MEQSEYQEILIQLDDTLNIIEKLRINFKKSPKARLQQAGYLKARLECLEGYWITFRELHLNLLKCLSKEKRATLSYFTNDEYSKCEEQYTELKADILDLLESQKSSPIVSHVLKHSNNASITEVKLPQINLPTFSGVYEEWQAFEDAFGSLIHNNTQLTDVQRFHYLKSCIHGEAKNVIKHISTTDKNYKNAWDGLRSRYSNKRLIVNSILKRLFNQKKITAPASSQLKGLLDTTVESLNYLNNIDVVTENWDPFIIYMVVQRLDQESHKEWENHVVSNDLPNLNSLVTFLENRIRTLELINANNNTNTRNNIKERSYVTSTPEKAFNCIMCNENHLLCHCKDFSQLDPAKRIDYVKEQKLCYNCLGKGHPVQFCRQKVSCKRCNKRHHTLLHLSRNTENTGNIEGKQSASVSTMHTNVEGTSKSDEGLQVTSHFTAKKHCALLATALVPVKNHDGYTIVLRALIDQGSQASFISERAAQLLKLKRKFIHGKVTGVGSTETKINHVVDFHILSRYSKEFKLNIKAYVMSTQLTTKLPSTIIHKETWPHLEGIFLADPNFHTPNKIDILLGVEAYTEILKNNLIKGPPGSPCAQETSLGWILFGNIEKATSSHNILVMHHQVDIDHLLRNLWELDISNKRKLTEEENKCEKIFSETFSRTDEGRYIVKLPIKVKDPVKIIGETRNIAIRRFQHLERRFSKNVELQHEYRKVFEDYITQNHIEKVPELEKCKPSVYLPHHAVCREDKETTKTRIVFDASCNGSNNTSLNLQMMIGPQLQEDLRNLIMRWRMKKICFISDIKAMYRQILVTEEDSDLQRIVWRFNNNEEFIDYRLKRVTFGTASAPYLAVRTLFQVADDEGQECTDAVKIIKEDFFMDDLMSGHDTVEQAVELMNQISSILLKGGFQLQKWSSNNASFMEHIPQEDRTSHVCVTRQVNGIMKALGIVWNMGTDSFQYEYNLPRISEVVTKRNILGDIQRLFDPLGWLAPAIVPAKIIIQKLWLERLTWDEEVNTSLENEWLTIRKSFEYLNKIKLRRWIHTLSDESNLTSIHGFCDASMKAYAAVVYCRTENKNGEIHTSILASKTRVAPVKPVSLPRLELCGAVLLARLLNQSREAMRIEASRVYAWTDSTVVLSWLFGDPNRWKPFVSNRVVEILEVTCNTQWFHVISKDNPADIASRGMTLSHLSDCKQWWEGPKWLKEKLIPFNRPNVIITDLEKRTKYEQVNIKIEERKNIDFGDFDTLNELCIVITYCRRFINSKKLPEKIDSTITTTELEETLFKCIRIIQGREYEDEIHKLNMNKPIKVKSNIRSLNPYLDEHGVLRVGGRINQAEISEERKHPIIIGYNNSLVRLIVEDAHRKTLHGGIQLMMSYIRSRFWIIKVKSSVKRCIHNCLICARQRATHRNQVMGELPKARVTPARAFLHCGVDFAGPLQVLCSRGRGIRTTKAYIAVYICMATKAIHLELVGSLSSEAFIGSFKRFIARRGRCAHIWSDQGRRGNFIGANKELVEAWKLAGLELPGCISEALAKDGTQWHFIPPYSPNFGGLWEAGVKSTKYHLKRILTKSMTFEEMTTVLCEIEACLNSRPLCIIENDTDQIEALTPGHFLIGEAPINVPGPNVLININLISRWQLAQKLVRDFWKRWQGEYLSRLQERPKWLKTIKEFEIGEILLIKEDNLPPGKWALGRVTTKHPGPDNITRVYSLKCGDKIIKRTVSRLCALPIKTD